MNQLQIFQNNTFGQVRVVEQNGEPWFVGAEIAKTLGYTNPPKAIRDHVDEEDKLTERIVLSGQNRQVTIINESGLYSLILSSKLPNAKEFKRWVTSEVLPSIRKHGAYLTDDVAKQVVQDPSFLIQIAQALQEEKAKRQEAEAMVAYQEQQIAEFKPVKDYVDQILSSTSTMTITQIAADYDLTAVQLNKILHEAGLQRKVGDQWILYKRHMSKGYTKSETFTFKRSDGRNDAKINTKWTQKGRLKIHEILTKRGIKAVCTEVA